MTKCPLCGGSGELPDGEPAEVENVLARRHAPAPSELYARTGGGEAYQRAMVQHGYVFVVGDARCDSPNGDGCACLLKRDHEGPHLCPHGDWS